MTQPVDLDPENWDEFRETSHRALDAMIDYLREVRARPVWREPSPEARERFARSCPSKNGNCLKSLQTLSAT